MSPVYTLCPVPPERADQAYPLAQAIEPRLALADWRRLFDGLYGTGGGQAVLAVTAATRRFYALCTVEVLRPSAAPPILALTRLMIGHPVDLISIGEALLQGLAAYARETGCAILRVATAGSDEQALRALCEAHEWLKVGLPLELV